MPVFKEVWSFSSPGGYTWNEVYYSEDDDITQAANFPPSFINSRLMLLQKLATWKKVRISDVLNPRVTVIKVIKQKGLLIDDPENGAEAAVFQLSSTTTPATRKLWLRGLAQGSLFRSPTTGEWEISPAFATNSKAFIGKLASNRYLVRSQTRDGQGGIVRVRVKTVDGTAANGITTITTDVASGVSTGDLVTFTQMDGKLFPGLKGIFKALSGAGLTFTIPYVVAGNQTLTATKGKAMKVTYRTGTTINAAASGFLYGTSRDTKNSDSGSRGAKRATRVRLLA